MLKPTSYGFLTAYLLRSGFELYPPYRGLTLWRSLGPYYGSHTPYK